MKERVYETQKFGNVIEVMHAPSITAYTRMGYAHEIGDYYYLIINGKPARSIFGKFYTLEGIDACIYDMREYDFADFK